MALLVSGSGQAASKADVGVTVMRGSAPGMLDFQLANQSFPGLSSFRLALLGVSITSITCPSGWTSQVSPTSGATCSGGSLGPGQTTAGSLTYGGSQPPTAGTLFVTNASGTESIPFTIPGSPTGGVPCTCIRLTASIVPSSLSLSVLRADVAKIEFKVRWHLTCAAGTGGGCTGLLDVVPAAKGPFHHVLAESGSPIECEGPCAGTRSGSDKVTLELAFEVFGNVREELAGRRVRVDITRHCGTKTLSPEKLWIAFDHVGRLDKKESKLH